MVLSYFCEQHENKRSAKLWPQSQNNQKFFAGFDDWAQRHSRTSTKCPAIAAAAAIAGETRWVRPL